MPTGPQVARVTPRHVRRQLAVASGVAIALSVMVFILGALGAGLVGFSGALPGAFGGGDDGSVQLRAGEAASAPTAPPAHHRATPKRSPAHAVAPAGAALLVSQGRGASTHAGGSSGHGRTHAGHHRASGRHASHRHASKPRPAPPVVTPAPPAAPSPVRSAASSAPVRVVHPSHHAAVPPGHAPSSTPPGHAKLRRPAVPPVHPQAPGHPGVPPGHAHAHGHPPAPTVRAQAQSKRIPPGHAHHPAPAHDVVPSSPVPAKVPPGQAKRGAAPAPAAPPAKPHGHGH